METTQAIINCYVINQTRSDTKEAMVVGLFLNDAIECT
jgi:hypothetical protein